MRRVWALCVLFVTWGGMVRAAAPPPVPLLAVLEFIAPEQAVGDAELMLLTNELRGAVIATVGSRYRVITRENMEVLLPPEQLSAARCSADKCVAEIGKMLQASHVLAGTVRLLDGELVLTLEGYETNGGVALGTEQLYAGKVRELLGAIKERAPALVRQWLRLNPVVVAPQAGRVGQEQAIDVNAAEELVVSFESAPAGAVVMLDGRLVCRSTPCSKALPVGEYPVTMSLEQYEDMSRLVKVSKSARLVRMELQANFATVRVETVPAGLPLSVDGTVVGAAPRSLRLAPGAHTVVVQDRCWQELGERIVVERGAHQDVTLKAIPRWAGLKVRVTDVLGNDVETDVLVDKASIGKVR